MTTKRRVLADARSGVANCDARCWHAHGNGALAHGFPYDDVGGYASDIGCNSPKKLIVGVGW